MLHILSVPTHSLETALYQARLASGVADDSEYLVQDAHDVSIKVLSTRYMVEYYLYLDESAHRF